MSSASGVETARRACGLVETTLRGRVTGELFASACRDARRLGGGPTWLICAEEVCSYSPDAVDRAIDELTLLHREHGLEEIVAVIVAPVVRMGATVVSMTLRTIGGGPVIHVVECRVSAQARLGARVAALRAVHTPG